MTDCWGTEQYDSPAAAFDIIAEFYDDDMGRTNPGDDIVFYTKHALAGSGPVLELGCGTGRISLPLVRAGCQVAGIDVSRRMLEALRCKADALLTSPERPQLKVFCADMRAFELHTRFPTVICPFSAFNYLVEDRELESALACIRKHLAPGGSFVLDTFVPDPAVLARPDDYVYLDYRRTRPDGTVLQREKRIRKNLSEQVNLVERTYTLLTSDGSLLRRVVTRERIRYFYPTQLTSLLPPTASTRIFSGSDQVKLLLLIQLVRFKHRKTGLIRDFYPHFLRISTI